MQAWRDCKGIGEKGEGGARKKLVQELEHQAQGYGTHMNGGIPLAV
jgi:hypothetical protein